MNERIHLIAPGKYCGNEVIQNGVSLLIEMGFDVVTGSNAQGHDGYFSGNLDERTIDMLSAIGQERNKVFFARGGYGAIQVLEQMDEVLLEERKPVFFGYSDATVFHLKMSQLNLPSVHSPMALDFPKITDNAKKHLQQVLHGEEIHYEFKGSEHNRDGTVVGQVTGGNLAVICSLLGSKHLPSFKNKILFIEEVGEALYAIDRMMMTLKLNGILDEISGLILGSFTSIGDSDPKFKGTVERIINNYVKEYDYPVCHHFPAGHIEDHHSLYFGTETVFTVNETTIELKQKPY